MAYQALMRSARRRTTTPGSERNGRCYGGVIARLMVPGYHPQTDTGTGAGHYRYPYPSRHVAAALGRPCQCGSRLGLRSVLKRRNPQGVSAQRNNGSERMGNQ